ncbi:MAG: hypothetical protein WCA63_07945 [Gallionella sp.]
MSLLLIVVVVVGALAWRGGAGVVEMDKGLETMRPLILMRHQGIALFAYLYLYFAIISGVANGYALLGFKGLIVLPIATWVAFQGIDILISRHRGLVESFLFNPIVNLIVFGSTYFILTVWLIWSLIAAA